MKLLLLASLAALAMVAVADGPHGHHHHHPAAHHAVAAPVQQRQPRQRRPIRPAAAPAARRPKRLTRFQRFVQRARGRARDLATIAATARRPRQNLGFVGAPVKARQTQPAAPAFVVPRPQLPALSFQRPSASSVFRPRFRRLVQNGVSNLRQTLRTLGDRTRQSFRQRPTFFNPAVLAGNPGQRRRSYYLKQQTRNAPSVFFKRAEDIHGYEKFTLDEVVHPEQQAQKRSDDNVAEEDIVAVEDAEAANKIIAAATAKKPTDFELKR